MSTSTWRVPGRLEVLGKHTDYAGGDVLVCAVDRGVTVTATTTGGPEVVARSTAYPEPVRLRPGEPTDLPPGHWGRYVQTAVDRLATNFGPVPGAEVEVSSDLPLASGMSSSSALIVGTSLALADAWGLTDQPRWKRELSTDLRRAGYLACLENGLSFGSLTGTSGVGTHGGSEDHTAMLCSAAGQLGVFGFDPVRLVRRVALPAGWSFVVAVSGVLAEKTGAALARYNAASAAVTELVARWQTAGGRETTLAAVVRSHPEAADRLRALVRHEDLLIRRLDAFLLESELLVPAAADALTRGDAAALGEVAARSQAGAAELLRNQVPETVALVRAGLSAGAVAASSFGAGFGGSVWALVADRDAAGFAAEWLAAYLRACPHVSGASAFPVRPSEAARSLSR